MEAFIVTDLALAKYGFGKPGGFSKPNFSHLKIKCNRRVHGLIHGNKTKLSSLTPGAEDIIKMKHVYEGAHDKHINLYKTFKEKQQKKELDPPPEPLPERELVLSLKKNDHDSSEEQSYDFDSETDDENDENINANTYDMSVETNAELIDYADSLYNTVENDGDGDCGYHSFIGSIKDNHKSLIKITKSAKWVPLVWILVS